MADFMYGLTCKSSEQAQKIKKLVKTIAAQEDERQSDVIERALEQLKKREVK